MIMKLIALLIISSTLSLSCFGQNKVSNNIPPLEMLPKDGETKFIYELSTKSKYKIFDSNGKLLSEGNHQFIDFSAYKEGAYFIHVGDRIELFEKK